MSNLGWQYLTHADKELIAAGIRDGVAYGGPFHVEIHPADRCNIDCFFCSTAAIRGTDELPLARFEQLVGELKTAGTRSIRFAGGGEPLFHRKFKEILRIVASSGIPIENITTNAVLLDGGVARLLAQTCDQVTISLNTGDAESYAEMMRTPSRNFERVLKNIRELISVRAELRSRRPQINLQFLVWRGNFRSIPQMYALSRELAVDTVLFSGLSFLPAEKRMSDDEVAEMLALYEDVIRLDEFRHITNIGSFERDISPEIDSIIHRLSAERASLDPFRRVLRYVTRPGSLRQKLLHTWKMHRARTRSTFRPPEACLIGWYSMLVRSDGTVGPCCILQHKTLGNIIGLPTREIWNGDSYKKFRRELTRIMSQGPTWSASATDTTVESVCGLMGTDLCPMKTFYFARDESFVRKVKPFMSSDPGSVTTIGAEA